MFPKENIRKELISKSPSSSNNAVDGGRRLNRGKPDPVSHLNRIKRNKRDDSESRAQRETDDGMSRISSRNRNVIKKKTLRVTDRTNRDNYSTPQELEIMNKFTSKEWSTKPYFKPTVNMQFENKEARADGRPEKRVSDGTVVETVLSEARTGLSKITDLTKGSVNDGENASFPSRQSSYGGSSRLFSRAERVESKQLNSSNENRSQKFSKVVRSDNKSLRSKKSTNNHDKAKTAGGSQITSKKSDKDAISRGLRSDVGKPLETYNNGSKKTNKTFTNRRSVEDDRYCSGYEKYSSRTFL